MKSKMSQSEVLAQYKHETEENYTMLTSYRIKDKEELKNDLKAWHNGKCRRPVFQTSKDTWNYVPVLCNYGKSCIKGLDCYFSHSKLERSFHPAVYKVKQCSNTSPISADLCLKSSKLCTFYHTENDRRTSGLQLRPFDLSTYKVFKCRLAQCGPDCVNYHNPNEKRRDPNVFSYSHSMCKFVQTDDLMSTNLCKNEDKCRFAHTKNEVLYHDKNYKQDKCQDLYCRLEFCSFVHEGNEEIGMRVRVSVRAVEEVDEAKWVDLNSAALDTSTTEKCFEARSGEERSSDSFSVSLGLGGNVGGLGNEEVGEVKDGSPGFEPCDEEEMRFNSSDYKCQLCRLSEITFLLPGCGALICPQCLTKSCPRCHKPHVVIVRF